MFHVAEAPHIKNVSSLKGEAVLTDLTANQLYMVRVRAVSSAGYGDYSSKVVKKVLRPPDGESLCVCVCVCVCVVVCLSVCVCVCVCVCTWCACER